jgi:hypothetical protein
MTCEVHGEVKEQLRDHEKRIVKLEKTDAEFTIKFDHLCKQLEQLTSWIKALVVSIISSGVGFVIWYIQCLPR